MHRSNCCNDLRLIAALLVIVSHSFMLTSGDNLHEPMYWMSGGQVTTGGLSVFTFMVISGYLITRSFEQGASVRRFVVARAVRILPALAVVLLTTSFLFGPWLTPLPAGEYFKGLAPVVYVAKNLSLLAYAEGLPGVLPTNPFPGIMNGSLWTLHIEAACYALVLGLGVARLLNRFVTTGLLLAGVLAMALSAAPNYPIVLMTHFLAGATLQQWRAPRIGALALACAAGLAAAVFAGGFIVASATAGAYLVFYVGFAPPILSRPLTGDSDLSYGAYIWAFPVQQVVVHLAGGTMSWRLNVAICLPIVLGLAWLSWHLIEKRALRWKVRDRVAARPAAPEIGADAKPSW